MSKGKVVPQDTHRTRNSSQVFGLGSVELCSYKACLLPSVLDGVKKSTVAEPVPSAVPAATASHGALGNAIPASSGTPAGCQERMQRFQEEGCSTRAFLQMNGKQVQLQEKDGERNSVCPSHFCDKHMGSSVCR